jgi:hypothetical protein
MLINAFLARRLGPIVRAHSLAAKRPHAQGDSAHRIAVSVYVDGGISSAALYVLISCLRVARRPLTITCLPTDHYLTGGPIAGPRIRLHILGEALK